jgi:hypothetical protein
MIVEPLYQEKKLASYLEEKPKNVLIVFWHGLGDCVQFASIYDHLQNLYPETHFDIALQAGLDEEVIFPEAKLITDLDNIEEDCDITFKIHFPVETPGLTKSELCCRDELGIPLMSSYKPLPNFPSKLCAVHFNLTCLPELANPDRDTAENIWNEIREAGWIPIETHFQHTFHNPVNEKFDFVDCTVRRCVPKVSTLIGLLQHCGAFIGVVSGNFHTAMAVMPHDRIAFLEKEIPVARFTNEPMTSFNLKDYRGGIKEWLTHLS